MFLVVNDAEVIVELFFWYRAMCWARAGRLGAISNTLGLANMPIVRIEGRNPNATPLFIPAEIIGFCHLLGSKWVFQLADPTLAVKFELLFASRVVVNCLDALCYS